MTLALLDTNVLVHAAFQSAPFHASAARLLDRGLRVRGTFCVAAQNLVEFAAVMTRPRLVANPLPVAQVEQMVNLLYASRLLRKIYPKRGTVVRMAREGVVLRFTGPAWYDLFLAATMRDAHVPAIVTEDVRTFRRIPFIETLSITEAITALD